MPLPGEFSTNSNLTSDPSSIPGLGQTNYLLPNGTTTSSLPRNYSASQLSGGPSSAAVSGGGPAALAQGGPGGTGSGVAPVGGQGAAASGGASSSATGSIAAGTSGNPIGDALEWFGSALNLVPGIFGGVVKFLEDGGQAVMDINHELAYALDTAVTMFKPGQAWRVAFTGATLVLAFFAFRAFTGRSLMPSPPAVIPV